MFTARNQLATFQQIAADNFVRFANVQLESTKRLAALNFTTAREWAEEGARNAQALSTVKDVKDAANVQSAAAKPVATKTLAYTRGVFDILTQANDQLKEISETQIAELNKQVAGSLDNAAENAPAGFEPVVALYKSSVSAATNAFDQVVKINKQLLAATEANLTAAFAAIEKPIVTASKQ